MRKPERGECICLRCIRENELSQYGGLPLSGTRMIVCPECGNKRCPKASDYRLACTGSNQPGQPGQPGSEYLKEADNALQSMGATSDGHQIWR